MSILKNAIDSIALGVEDYKSTDPRRMASCARNIFAGILLLFKHKLAELSPSGSDEALIKQRVLPVITSSGDIMWRGEGRKTVDVQQIRERFKTLNISVEWERVDAINSYRNDIEHYYSSVPQNNIRAMIDDSFIVIRNFVSIHLQEEPLTLLGKDVWEVLVNESEVYEKEKEECTKHISAVDWIYTSIEDALIKFRCPQCGSGLIDVTSQGTKRETAEFHCRSCGQEWEFDTIVPLAFSDYYAGKNFMSIKDGGDPFTITCPNCSNDTYILSENVCVMCCESVERECQRCGCEIPPEEIDESGYCGWCNHMMSKDD
ncbi:MAG: hypothetical protein WC454_06495 [Phycisphaerae bacterium]|jgi:predicted RNA-binding Zn-ribbon protein involved in translation (DUF1610 family)